MVIDLRAGKRLNQRAIMARTVTRTRHTMTIRYHLRDITMTPTEYGPHRWVGLSRWFGLTIAISGLQAHPTILSARSSKLPTTLYSPPPNRKDIFLKNFFFFQLGHLKFDIRQFPPVFRPPVPPVPASTHLLMYSFTNPCPERSRRNEPRVTGHHSPVTRNRYCG
jgi:hypothetical protein